MAEGTTSSTAVGGMATKIEAAKIATKSGCAVLLEVGKTLDGSLKLLKVRPRALFLLLQGSPLNQRKKWLAFFPSPKGSIEIDEGACQAILEKG